MQDELRRGYEILLGRPLESFDTAARYELWFFVDSDVLPEEDRVTSLTREQLAAGRPPAPASTYDTRGGEFWKRYAVDYAHTLFVYDKHDLGDAPPELVALLQASQYTLTGLEMVKLVERTHLGLPELLRRCWYACRRAVTDGTLVDAMAAATLSASAPDGLMARASYEEMASKIRFEPRWENMLQPIGDPALREHLLMSCVDLQTARWAGAWFDPKRKPDVWLEPVTRRGGEILAIWHMGEGQGTRAVVKLTGTGAPIAVSLAADESIAMTMPVVEVAPPKPPTKRARRPTTRRNK